MFRANLTWIQSRTFLLILLSYVEFHGQIFTIGLSITGYYHGFGLLSGLKCFLLMTSLHNLVYPGFFLAAQDSNLSTMLSIYYSAIASQRPRFVRYWSLFPRFSPRPIIVTPLVTTYNRLHIRSVCLQLSFLSIITLLEVLCQEMQFNRHFEVRVLLRVEPGYFIANAEIRLSKGLYAVVIQAADNNLTEGGQHVL